MTPTHYPVVCACGSDWPHGVNDGNYGLVDLNAIAAKLEVAYGTLVQWRHRGQFVEPDIELSVGPLWFWETVRTWAIATGRLDP